MGSDTAGVVGRGPRSAGMGNTNQPLQKWEPLPRGARSSGMCVMRCSCTERILLEKTGSFCFPSLKRGASSASAGQEVPRRCGQPSGDIDQSSRSPRQCPWVTLGPCLPCGREHPLIHKIFSKLPLVQMPTPPLQGSKPAGTANTWCPARAGEASDPSLARKVVAVPSESSSLAVLVASFTSLLVQGCWCHAPPSQGPDGNLFPGWKWLSFVAPHEDESFMLGL